MIDRREALRRFAVLTGGAVSLSTAAGVMSGCEPAADDAEWTPQTLSEPEFDLMGDVVERILPTTDTPGAREARVHTFIDRMLTEWMPTAERDHFLDGLDRVDAVADAEFGASFTALSDEDQDAVLRTLEDEASDQDPETVIIDLQEAWPDFLIDESLVSSTGRSTELEVQLQPFFSHVKELTLVGYYTSEIGATQELQYEHVPGRYDGCVPLEEVGRTWA